MKKTLVLVLVLILAVLLISCKGDTGPTGAAGDPSLGILSMSFQEGLLPYAAYDGTLDSYMSSLSNTTGYESSTVMNAGNYSALEIVRAIIRFDLTAVAPQDIVVKKAYLTLYDVMNTGTAPTLTAYKVTRFWDVTVRWDRSVTGLSWAGAEGYYAATPASDSVTMDLNSNVMTLSLDTNMVQEWIQHSITNYGVILKTSSDGTSTYNRLQFNSSDFSNPETRPKLTIYYTLP